MIYSIEVQPIFRIVQNYVNFQLLTIQKYADSITWLEDSNLVHVCRNVFELYLPLEVNSKDIEFKLYYNDIFFEFCTASFSSSSEGPLAPLPPDTKLWAYASIISAQRLSSISFPSSSIIVLLYSTPTLLMCPTPEKSATTQFFYIQTDYNSSIGLWWKDLPSRHHNNLLQDFLLLHLIFYLHSHYKICLHDKT